MTTSSTAASCGSKEPQRLTLSIPLPRFTLEPRASSLPFPKNFLPNPVGWESDEDLPRRKVFSWFDFNTNTFYLMGLLDLVIRLRVRSLLRYYKSRLFKLSAETVAAGRISNSVIRSSTFELLKPINEYQTTNQPVLMESTLFPTKIGKSSFQITHDVFQIVPHPERPETEEPRRELVARLQQVLVLVSEDFKTLTWPCRDEIAAECKPELAIDVSVHSSPTSKPQAGKYHVFQMRTRTSDVDGLAHVNNLRYVDYFMDARLARLIDDNVKKGKGSDVSLWAKYYSALASRLAVSGTPDILQLSVDYIAQAYGGEDLEVHSWPHEVVKANSLGTSGTQTVEYWYHYQLIRVIGGKVLATASIRTATPDHVDVSELFQMIQLAAHL